MKTLKTFAVLILAVVFAFGTSLAFADTGRMGAKSITFNRTAYLAKSANYTVTTADNGKEIGVTCSSANITITLPSVESASTGGTMRLMVRKKDATDYKVVVTPATGDTIGFESTRYLTYDEGYMVISTGQNNSWTVEYESPYVIEDYEAGTVDFNALGSAELTSDTVLSGTTPLLTIGDAGAEDTQITFDGNAQDFYACLDDSADDLVFGLGATCGTTPAFAIDENQVTTWTGGTIELAEVVTSANVLTAAECGKVMFLNAAAEFQTTLPALSTTAAGCEFTFIVKGAAAAANYTIITGNTTENKIYGSMEVAGAIVACADEDTITLVDGNAVGDWVKVMSDGANWYLFGSTVTAAKATCTQAS